MIFLAMWPSRLLLDLYWDFSGGPVVKTLPCCAGNTGLISGPGKSHM